MKRPELLGVVNSEGAFRCYKEVLPLLTLRSIAFIPKGSEGGNRGKQHLSNLFSYALTDVLSMCCECLAKVMNNTETMG